MKNLYYIAIEGPIGVGKTSLANLMSKELSARLVLEEFEENPFLPDFYKDPERYSFQTQLFFLLQRYRQQQELRQVDMFQKAYPLRTYNQLLIDFETCQLALILAVDDSVGVKRKAGFGRNTFLDLYKSQEGTDFPQIPQEQA